MAIDDGHAVHFSELKQGTPVYDSNEVEVGTVQEALDTGMDNIFDGLVVDTPDGPRFVDAPEVARTAELAVTLTITADEVKALSPPERKPIVPPRPASGLGRFFRRRR